MRKHRNRILAGLALVFVIYLLLLLFTNTGELLAQLQTYPWAILVPVVLLKSGAWFLRFWRWHYFLGVIDAAHKISKFDSAVIFVSGFTLTVSPGKLGELLKAVVLKAKTGTPISRSAPIVIAERVMDGIAVLLMLLLAFFLAGDGIDIGPYRFLVLLAGALLVVGLVAIQIRPLAYFFLNLLRHLPLLKRLYTPLVEFYESSREIFHFRHILPTAFLGSVAHLLDALSFCLILSGFGLEVTWMLYLQGVFITGLTAAIGALSGVPNGAGVTEISSSGMILAIIAPTHALITSSVAMTAALIEGFSHKWLRVLVGLVVAVVFRRRLFPETLDAELAEFEAENRAVRPVESEGAAA
ncbi:MAG TPA: lysylphosphatidylglycerol synthase transmembrane domain-containing protein [Phototrophicaceae bacterium]|nr:lysylphosphatidylglycerol synthase transmembrane domain-containing protein [Phototrophicaceae bacterium]